MGEIGTRAFSDDDSVPDDWLPKVGLSLIEEGLKKMGRISATGEWMEKLLKDAGFVDVTVNHTIQYWRCNGEGCLLRKADTPAG